MVDIGDVAPDFALQNQDGKEIRLSDFRGKRVVLFTFPKAGTYGCTKQACSLRNEFPHLEAANTVVLGISADPSNDLHEWKLREKLPYDLLSDPDHDMLKAWGLWGINMLGIVKIPMIHRSLWVIDESGVVFEKHVPVGTSESAAKAANALKRMAQQTRQADR